MNEYDDLLENRHKKNNSINQTFNIRLLIAFAVYIIIFILPSFITLVLSLIFPSDSSTQVESTPMDVFTLSIINFSVYGIVGIVFIALLFKYYWYAIKDYIKKPGYNTLVAVLGWIAGIMTMMILGVLMTFILGINETSQNQQTIQDSLRYPLLIIPPVILIAPIVEETVFRGIIFKYMTKIPLPKYISVGLAFLFSSFLFGFIHIISEVFVGNFGEFVQILPYMGLGLILATVYYLTNNIMVPIIMHAIQNTFSIIMSYIYLLLPESLIETEGAFVIVRELISFLTL